MRIFLVIALLAVGGAVLFFQGLSPEPAISSSLQMPEPTGPFGVGAASYHWIDEDRLDPILTDEQRQVVVQIWYPAEIQNNSERAPYIFNLPEVGGNAYVDLHRDILTNAFLHVPFASDASPAPVILFSTGRSLATYDYTTLAEELASHGYVVVGVNSPHLSRVFLPDGNFIGPSPQWAPTPDLYADFALADAFFEPGNVAVSGDLHFVREQVEELNISDPILSGHLDFNRMGMMGHSSGAMAGSRACAEDILCDAFLGIEGAQTRELRKAGVDKPFALLISEQSLSFDVGNVYREIGIFSSDFHVFRIDGAGHNSFTDLLLVRPNLFDYPMETMRGVEITRSLTLGFFETYLQNSETVRVWPQFDELIIEASGETDFGVREEENE